MHNACHNAWIQNTFPYADHKIYDNISEMATMLLKLCN